MTERMKRVAAALMAACLLAVFAPVHMLTSYAANAKIAFSDPSATVGGQVSVNMKITSSGGENLSSADIVLSYDANALEFVSGTDASGDSGAIRVHGDAGTPNTASMTFVLKFNARAAGTTKIEVTSQEIYDTASKLVTVDKQGNSTVTVSALATASKDATLKSLQVSPGSLTPAFSPDVDTYAVTVGTDVTKIIVSAECTDDNATKIIKGNEDLQMGENRVTCRVTAQDGETAKEYVIVVTKAEGGASSSEGAGQTATGVKLTAMNRSITILEPDPSVQLPSGFVESSIDIDGNKVKGWTWGVDNNPQYCVVYGMNEAGEKNFYRYDMNINEHTIQRYFEDPATADISGKYDALVSEYNSLCKDYEMRLIVIIVLAVIAVILLILAVWQIVSKNKPSDPGSGGPRRKSRARRAEERLEDDDSGYDEYEEDVPREYPEDAYEPYDEQGEEGGLDVVDVLDGEDDPEPEEIRFEPQVRRAREAEEAARAQQAARGQAAVTREPARTAAPSREARQARVPADNSRRAPEERAAGGTSQAAPTPGTAQGHPVNRSEQGGQTRPARPERGGAQGRPQRQTAAGSAPAEHGGVQGRPQPRAERRTGDNSQVRPARRPAESNPQPRAERPAGESRPQPASKPRRPQAGPGANQAERPQTRAAQPGPAAAEADDEFEVIDLE